MELNQKILKATLMLRMLGNKSSSKEEQICEFTEWYTVDRESELDEWINSMRVDILKTPEEREEESRKFLEELIEREAEMEYKERKLWRRERDEWDDYWDDRARSVGAINY